MGQAVPIRTDYTAGEVRRFAKCAKDGAQARRLLALAAVLDGVSREEAAKLGGMDRQTLRDWVIRFNEQGPDGLINIPSPGAPPKLDDMHKAFLRRIVDEGPIPSNTSFVAAGTNVVLLGIGPSSTIRRRKALCMSSSLGGAPGEGMLMRPSGPCSLNRITQSRNVWRSIHRLRCFFTRNPVQHRRKR